MANNKANGISNGTTTLPGEQCTNSSSKLDELSEVRFGWRVVDSPLVGLLLFLSIPIGMFSATDLADKFILQGAFIALIYLALSGGNWIGRRKDKIEAAVRLNREGLHLDERFLGPIPWRSVISAEKNLWSFSRSVSVQIEQGQELRIRPPFPLSVLGAPAIGTPVRTFTISCWSVAAERDHLLAEIERFRIQFGAALSEKPQITGPDTGG